MGETTEATSKTTIGNDMERVGIEKDRAEEEGAEKEREGRSKLRARCELQDGNIDKKEGLDLAARRLGKGHRHWKTLTP